ncbi:MAG: general stress protein CsbD [Methylotenera sp.]|nr:MAG: general stress protein CsbD [Methylotenera sp.]PPD17316.1 MAG: general stress protein CsbD [Methylotenera sp.]
MDWQQIESNWAQFKSIIKHDWDKLTDTHLDEIAGRRNYLVRKIQSIYGLSQTEVDTQLTEWQENQINIDGHFYQSKPFLLNAYIR